jgi:asparagine synthase (glutamine-hydrolysing)
MPGLFGIVRRDPRAGMPAIEDAFARLFAPGDPAARTRAERLADPDGRWALGRAHRGVLQPAPQLACGADVQVLFHGDLQNTADLQTSVDHDAKGSNVEAADLVRKLYEREGLGFASRLRGSHCAVILDCRSRTAALLNDRLGSYPLYWATTDRGLVFASELRAVLRSGESPRELDPAGLADCLTFGFPLGNKTLARGVELVPPGSALRYRWDTGELTVERYAPVAAFSQWSGTKNAFLDELTESFHRAVERAFDGDHAFGLALSGGLDSRAILSVLDGRASALTTYTLGVDGCADQVIADRLSSIARTKHVFFELDNRYLADFLPNLERMVWLTDGMYLSHGLTEILALRFLDQTGIEVLLRGHGGELAKTGTAWPFHTDGRIQEMRDRRELVPYLVQRNNYISASVDLGSLFTPAWARETAGSARASLERAVRSVELSPVDLCSYLYITEHHRRSSIPSLELFRESVEVRLPFLDDEFVALLLRAPAAWRDGFEIHRALTAKSNPKLLRVRNSNTGAPASAGPLVEAAADKLNTVLRRLNVHGYRHYHQFDAWMSTQLLEHADSVLLDRSALERGIYEEQTLRRVIEQTRSGKANHSFLLLALLIVEIWQRQNL